MTAAERAMLLEAHSLAKALHRHIHEKTSPDIDDLEKEVDGLAADVAEMRSERQAIFTIVQDTQRLVVAIADKLEVPKPGGLSE